LHNERRPEVHCTVMSRDRRAEREPRELPVSVCLVPRFSSRVNQIPMFQQPNISFVTVHAYTPPVQPGVHASGLWVMREFSEMFLGTCPWTCSHFARSYSAPTSPHLHR
jgi:hypothetical protein